MYDIESYGPAKVAGEKGTYKLTINPKDRKDVNLKYWSKG
jgi:hypothetical protein